jgi:hypothetical protein
MILTGIDLGRRLYCSNYRRVEQLLNNQSDMIPKVRSFKSMTCFTILREKISMNNFLPSEEFPSAFPVLPLNSSCLLGQCAERTCNLWLTALTLCNYTPVYTVFFILWFTLQANVRHSGNVSCTTGKRFLHDHKMLI